MNLSLFPSYGTIRSQLCPPCFRPQVWSLSEQGSLLGVLEGVGAPVSLLARGGPLVASASH